MVCRTDDKEQGKERQKDEVKAEAETEAQVGISRGARRLVLQYKSKSKNKGRLVVCHILA